MAYSKTTWVAGGAPGISAANLNNLETQYEKVVGTANDHITAIKALLLATDTRSLVATAWDADDRPTALEIRNGAAVVATIAITYNADGRITSLVGSGGGTTVTYTLTWTGDKFANQTKAVS